jgi:hypothetical protein
MSKFMLIIGLILAAIGLALGMMVFFSPGKIMAFGISPDVAATLLVGGILAMGLGGIISALGGHAHQSAEMIGQPAGAPVAAAAAAVVVAATTDKVASVAEKAAEGAKATTAEAVAALEKAKTDIAEALGLPSPETPDPEVAAADDGAMEPEDGELFVVEEKEIRGRQARLLSDGTVEAETEEGWMRFENMEHLEEYLDAMAPIARG